MAQAFVNRVLQFHWSSCHGRRILDKTEMMNWIQADAEALFLACPGNTDPGAWKEFFGRYGELISRTAVRVVRRWADFRPEIIEEAGERIVCPGR